MSRCFKVHLVYDVPGWAYYRRCQGLASHAPDDFDVTTQDWLSFERDRDEVIQTNDLIYDCEYVCASAIYPHFNNNSGRGSPCLYVTSFNADHTRRRDIWCSCLKHSHFMVANNQRVFDFNDRPKGTCNISNAVDNNIFHPLNRQRGNSAAWCGSASPKKCKRYASVIAPLERMSEIGEVPFGTSFRVIDDVNAPHVYGAKRQNEWYNEHKVVLCTSSSEGTPNYLLEGAMTGCVPVTTPVGNSAEWIKDGVNGYIIPHDNITATITAINDAIHNFDAMSAAITETMQSWTYKTVAPYFYQLFRRLIVDGPRSVNPFTRNEIECDQI